DQPPNRAAGRFAHPPSGIREQHFGRLHSPSHLPKGTPAPIIQKLYGTIVAAMNARSGISLKEESEPYPGRKQGGNTDDHPGLTGSAVCHGFAAFFERSLSQRIVDGAGRYNSAAKVRRAD